MRKEEKQSKTKKENQIQENQIKSKMNNPRGNKDHSANGQNQKRQK